MRKVCPCQGILGKRRRKRLQLFWGCRYSWDKARQISIDLLLTPHFLFPSRRLVPEKTSVIHGFLLQTTSSPFCLIGQTRTPRQPRKAQPRCFSPPLQRQSLLCLSIPNFGLESASLYPTSQPASSCLKCYDSCTLTQESAMWKRYWIRTHGVERGVRVLMCGDDRKEQWPRA